MSGTSQQVDSMDVKAAVSIMALMAVAAQAHVTEHTPERKVTICMEIAIDFVTVSRAQAIASKAFAGAGLSIDWQWSRACKPGEEKPVWISLDSPTPPDLLPGALAYALPYEGTHIRVFYDRVQRSIEHARLCYLLAYVLIHEITHVLQGVGRHSERGVMKPRWEARDYIGMECGTFSLTEEDVRLIHRGLDARTRRALAQASSW